MQLDRVSSLRRIDKLAEELFQPLHEAFSAAGCLAVGRRGVRLGGLGGLGASVPPPRKKLSLTYSIYGLEITPLTPLTHPLQAPLTITVMFLRRQHDAATAYNPVLVLREPVPEPTGIDPLARTARHGGGHCVERVE
jgi:hypothetical protein